MREEFVESFIVYGLSVRTNSINERTPKKAKLPKLWGDLCTTELITKGMTYGVYSDYDNGENGNYTTLAGIQSDIPIKRYKKITVQNGKYLVFSAEGELHQIVGVLWLGIWEFFKENPQYIRNFKTDFEKYISLSEVEIFIGIDS